MRKNFLWISILLVAVLISIPLTNLGTVSSSTVGWIKGRVTDPLTGSPIVGATVTADGYTNTTNQNGNYTIEVEAGMYNVTASAEDYRDKVVTNVNVTAGGTVIVHFALSKAVISVKPPISSAPTNKTFTVNITITDVFNLYFWEFHMKFDPNILKCTKVSEGPFLKAVDSTSWSMMPPRIDNYAGTVKASDLLWYYPAEGATGSGTLCNITFQVKAEGKNTLDFYYNRTCTYDGTKLVPIEHVAEDGIFWFPGDADLNRFVDMYDFYKWREYFGKSAGQWPPNVNPDFDGNWLVEMADFYVWRDHLGKEDP